MSSYWSAHYSDRTRGLTSSAIRELLKLTQRPEVISFAGGLPAAELFPVEGFREAACELLEEHGETSLQYSTTEGYPPLREMIARHVGRYGVEAEPDNILITTGSQQALDLLGKLLIDRGDPVLVERPSYLGALQAFKVYGPRFRTLPLDEEGMTVVGLEGLLTERPKFLYLLPNFHNPAGVTLSLERRQRIAELARAAGVPIVEDDPYGQLRYEGDHLPTVYSLDRELAGAGSPDGNVVYMSSFSKVLAPGLRLGWVTAPQDVIGRLVQLKQGADLHTSTFCQMLAHRISRDGFLDRNTGALRVAYKERRDAMLAAMDRHFPSEVTWTRPEGGLFLWLTLPESMDSDELLAAALERRVAFVPGEPFYAQGEGGSQHCRLNYSCMPPDRIEEGIRRLGAVLEEKLGESARPDQQPQLA